MQFSRKTHSISGNQLIDMMTIPFAKSLKRPESDLKTFILTNAMRRTSLRLNKFAVLQSDMRPGDRVLDVGCGRGYGLKMALYRVAPLTVDLMRYNPITWVFGPQWKAAIGIKDFEVHSPLDAEGYVEGVDISEFMVNCSKNTLRNFKRGDRFSVTVNSVHNLPQRSASVDVCLHVDCFYFWPSLRVGLEEIHRVLRPGGRLVTTYSPARLRNLENWRGLRYGRANPLEYVIALEETGFDDVEWIRNDPKFPNLHCIKAKKPKLKLLVDGVAKVSDKSSD